MQVNNLYQVCKVPPDGVFNMRYYTTPEGAEVDAQIIARGLDEDVADALCKMLREADGVWDGETC